MAIKVNKSTLEAAGYKYRWQAEKGDDPTKTRHDAIMFNRREGYEVVRMVQKVVDHFGYENADDVKRIAQVIATELPGNVRSRKNVFNWLREYFETH